MQVGLFQTTTIDSGVGELHKGYIKPSVSTEKPHLDYPELRTLLTRVRNLLEKNKEIVFKTKKVFEKNSDISSEDYLNAQPLQNQNPFNGIMTTHFGSLLNQNTAGHKFLGSYSLAYIEAKASKIYHQHFYGQDRMIDHFYCAKGISNISVIEDVIKAHEIPKNELAVVLTPSNAIKAFRQGRFSKWQNIETKDVRSSFGTLYQVDPSGEKISEINLINSKIVNLNSPIYKVKTGEYWTIIVPWAASPETINQEIELKISKNSVDAILNNKEFINEHSGTEVIEASIGQAARVIYEILGADYEMIPEALLNLEGGSWSSIALESSSSGRHNGTNSMHEVLKHGWHKHSDIAIPWFYLGFDRITETNKHLTADSENYILCFDNDESKKLTERQSFIECPQNWKRVSQELLNYVTRFVYKEYTNLGSKKFLLSTKELMLSAAGFLANWSINNFDTKSVPYAEGLNKLNINKELSEFLEIIAYVHLMSSAKADFYSSKTHRASIARLQCLAKIQKKLEKFCPVSVRTFSNKVHDILSKDIKSEFCTLRDLYQSELNKLG
jgi:hypothetical protein